MIHLLSQLDPMVWLMMVVVAIGFVVSAAVLVELLPGSSDDVPAYPPSSDGEADAPGLLGEEQEGGEVAPLL
jgi:hypothetical protein